MKKLSRIAVLVAASLAGTAFAQSVTYEQIEPFIVDRNPQTRVESVDHERLVGGASTWSMRTG